MCSVFDNLYNKGQLFLTKKNVQEKKIVYIKIKIVFEYIIDSVLDTELWPNNNKCVIKQDVPSAV